jgi:phosphatidylserine/phosphatidylglycerophosphate/cardiolipin synthase-like enzyme
MHFACTQRSTDKREAGGADINDRSILRTGDTCWRVSDAERVQYLVDGENFFSAFRAAAREAERSILMLGWDMHSA